MKTAVLRARVPRSLGAAVQRLADQIETTRSEALRLALMRGLESFRAWPPLPLEDETGDDGTGVGERRHAP